MQLAVCHASGLDGVDDDDAEDQRCQRIHGLVALQKALGQCGCLRGVFLGARAVAACRSEHSRAAQYD